MLKNTYGGILPLVLLMAAPPGCGGVPAGGPAGHCADVVRFYRGLQDAVVVGQPVETSEGSAEIEYEGTDDMNVPVKGSAACTFAVGKDGALVLIEAVVDGSPLDQGEIDATRRKLGAG